jgi:eukaryotic-like serine/threonine-protein kinase
MTSLPFQLGPYRCVKQVGSDELAEVFLAELSGEAGFVKQYALKRFNERATALPGFVAGMTRDAQRNTNLGHGNIVRVVGFDRFEDSHVLVAEYVDGISLRSILDRLRAKEDRVPWTLAAHLTIALGQALDHAHGGEPSTPHGALSPNHVMLTLEGGVRILNFGLAWPLARSKNLVSKQAAEEYAYLAPEQLESSNPSPPADLFSLGVVLYEMVTGQALFQLAPGNRRRLIPSPMKALEGDLDPLKPILTRLLIKDPAKRFESAGDAVEALQVLQHEKGQAVSSRPLIVWLEEVLRSPEKPLRGRTAGLEFSDKTEDVSHLMNPDPLAPNLPGGAPSSDISGADNEMEFDDDDATVVASFAQRTTEPEDLQQLAKLSNEVPDLPEEDDGFKEDDPTREIGGMDILKSRPSALPLPPLPGGPLGNDLASDAKSGQAAPGTGDLDEPAEPDEPTAEKQPMVGSASTSEPKATPEVEFDVDVESEPVDKPELTPEPKPEPAPSPEPKYSSGKATATVTEPIRMAPPAKAGASKGMVFAFVVITILCLASAGVAVFLYLELAKMQDAARTSKSGDANAGQSMTPQPPRRPPPKPNMTADPMAADPMAADPMAADPMAANPMAADPMAADPMAADPATAPPAKPTAIWVVPRKGTAAAYEIDLLTAPRGVGVIYNNYLLGKTPIRLHAKKGKRYLLVLNKEGQKVKPINPKFSRFAGLRHRIILKSPTNLARLGTEGQTRLEIRCRTSGIYRVFLNGRDTGRNCPVTLKVSRGPNAPGIYLPAKDHVTFRKVKSLPQKAVIVEFPH